jgi:hypothetical protein
MDLLLVAELTGKQQAFVEHYLTCWNAAKAARLAGYSKKTARVIGPENLSKPAIREAIDARLKEMALGADEVIARLSQYATGSLAEFISIRKETMKDGKEREVGYIDLAKIKRSSRAHLVKKLNLKEMSIELHDAHAALRDLGRYHKLFVDRLLVDDWRAELASAGLRPSEVDEVYEEIVAFASSRIAARLAARNQ